MYLVPDAAILYGFGNDPAGTHGSRTIMLSELRQLLGSMPRDAAYDDFVRAIVEENVLGKRTMATRKESVRRLRELYALNPDVSLFRALRDLWEANTEAQPLLAFLCASARDPILRASAGLVQETPQGEMVTPQMIEVATAQAFPERYNATMLANIGRHAASSWQQAGYLQGKMKKTRSRALAQPESTAYALYLGHLCGAGGEALFSTFWAKLLDAPAHALHEQARIAAQHGWIAYRSLGGVTEVEFPHLPRPVEQQ